VNASVVVKSLMHSQCHFGKVK